MDGLDVARAMRRAGDVPIIMLTARTEEADRVAGLELGADDYVTKPFSAREIVARVRAVLRRAQSAAMRRTSIRVGDSIVLDAPRMQVAVDGHDVILTATEFQLLLHMARQPGRVFTRAQLLDAVHGVAVESYERAIDAHVKNMRRKIEQRSAVAAPPADGVRRRIPPRRRRRVSSAAAVGEWWAPSALVAGGRGTRHGPRGRTGGGTGVASLGESGVFSGLSLLVLPARSSVWCGCCSAPSGR